MMRLLEDEEEAREEEKDVSCSPLKSRLSLLSPRVFNARPVKQTMK